MVFLLSSIFFQGFVSFTSFTAGGSEQGAGVVLPDSDDPGGAGGGGPPARLGPGDAGPQTQPCRAQAPNSRRFQGTGTVCRVLDGTV
jgi:hypothetical protein